MKKELTIKVNDNLYKKLNNHEMKEKDVVTKALHQFFENKGQKDEKNNKTVTTLKKNIKNLKNEKKTLEIEKVCLINENKNLQTRIDDLAQLYPSAVALLGKADETRMVKKNRWLFRK